MKLVNYGILDSFKKNGGARNFYEQDENDNSPSKVNPMESPVRTVETRREPPPMVAPVQVAPSINVLLPTMLLGVEVLRLREVVEQFEGNLQKLSHDNGNLQADNDRLKQEKDALLTQIEELKRRPMTIVQQPSPQKQVIVQSRVQTPPQAQQTVQPIIIQQAPQPVVPQPPGGTITLDVKDYIQDDKNQIVQMLVRKNLENDQLRRQIEAMRAGEIVQQQSSKNEARELINKIADVLERNKNRSPQMASDFEIARLKAEGLTVKLDALQQERFSIDARPEVPSLNDNVKYLHQSKPGVNGSYETERNMFFENLDKLIRKLLENPQNSLHPNQPSGHFEGGYSPSKSNLPQPETPQNVEYRTEIINGVPTRVRVIRKEVPVLDIHKSAAFPIHQTSPFNQDQRAELAAALKKINDLEAQNQLLMNRLAKGSGLGSVSSASLTGPYAEKIMAGIANRVGADDLRNEVAALRADAQEWRWRAEQKEVSLEKADAKIEELRDKINLLERDLEHSSMRERDWADRIAHADRDADTLNKRLREAEDKLREIKMDLEAERTKREQALEEARLAASSARDRIREAERKTDEKMDQIDQLRHDVGVRNGKIAELEGKLIGAAEDLARVKHQLREAEANSKDKEYEEALRKINEKETDIYLLRQNEKKLNDDLAEADNTINFLKDKALEQSQNLQRASRAEDDLQKDIAKLREDIDKDQQRLALEKSAKKNRAGVLVGKIKTLANKIGSIQRELDTTRAHLMKGTADYKRTLNILATLLLQKAELNPRGTLHALKQMKERHNSEVPNLRVRLSTFQDMLSSKTSEHSSVLHEKQAEIETLEKKLKEEREAKYKYETESKDVKDKEKKVSGKLETIEEEKKQLESDLKQLRHEVKSKDKHIKELKEELESQIKKIQELKDKVGSFETQLKQAGRDTWDHSGQRNTTSDRQGSVFLTAEHMTLGRSPHSFTSSPSMLPEMINMFIDPDQRQVHYQIESSPKSPERRQEEQLREANERVRYLERQLAGEAIAVRQADHLNKQIQLLEERLHRLTSLLEAKDKEIEQLRRGGSPRLTSPNSEEGDKIEVLRQRTEAMLSKVEKQVNEIQSRHQQPDRGIDRLLEEIKSLRKKLGESSKKYINDYIAVCQRSLDIYELLQTK